MNLNGLTFGRYKELRRRGTTPEALDKESWEKMSNSLAVWTRPEIDDFRCRRSFFIRSSTDSYIYMNCIIHHD